MFKTKLKEFVYFLFSVRHVRLPHLLVNRQKKTLQVESRSFQVFIQGKVVAELQLGAHLLNSRSRNFSSLQTTNTKS